jgi:predicted transcriptional regulator
MGQAMVRINDHTHQSLREMAQAEHQSMQAVLEKAVEEYRRRRFLEDVNSAYAALRNDPEAWQEIQAERAEWEALSDGLPEAETWTEEGQVSTRNGKRIG